jgi:hypothetical protein
MIGKRFDRIDRMRGIAGNVPIRWVKKFGLVEVFHAGVSKKLLSRPGAIVEWPTRKKYWVRNDDEGEKSRETVSMTFAVLGQRERRETGRVRVSLKVESFLPNYGFYGPQQPIAASGEPSCIHDLVMRFDTGVSDRRKTRGSSDERWTPRQTGLFIRPPAVLECPEIPGVCPSTEKRTNPARAPGSARGVEREGSDQTEWRRSSR